MRVVVASHNPVKLQAVETAWQEVFQGHQVVVLPCSVPSGVSDQPLSEEETYLGAFNRVQRARLEHPNADFWVGIEGGIHAHSNELAAFAWIAITNGKRLGQARTATFFLPPRVVRLIKAGKELGEADDIVFGRSQSKKKEGAVGLLTRGIIDRKRLYADAIILALIPFVNAALYPPERMT